MFALHSFRKAICKGLVEPHVPLLVFTLVSSILLCLSSFDYESTPLVEAQIRALEFTPGLVEFDTDLNIVTFGVLGFCYQSDEVKKKVCSSPKLGYNIDTLHDYEPVTFPSWSAPISNALVFHVIAFCFYSLEVAVIILSFLKVTSIGDWISEITLCISTTALAAFVVDLSLFSSVNTTVQGSVMMFVRQGAWYSLVAFLLLFLGACNFKARTRNSSRIRQPPPLPEDRAAEEGRQAITPPPSLPQPEKADTDLNDIVGEYGQLLFEFIDASTDDKDISYKQRGQTTHAMYDRNVSKSLPPIPVSPKTVQLDDSTDAPNAQRGGPILYPRPSIKIVSKRTTRNLADTDGNIRYSTLDTARLSIEFPNTTRSSHTSQSPISSRRTQSIPFAPSSYYHVHRRGTSTSSSPLPFNPNMEVPEYAVFYLDPARRSSSCLVYTDSSSTRTRKSTGQSSLGGSSLFQPARASSVFMHSTQPPSRQSSSLSKKPSIKSQRSHPSTPRTPFIETFLRDLQEGEHQGALVFFPSLRVVPRVPESEPIPDLPKLPPQSLSFLETPSDPLHKPQPDTPSNSNPS